MNKFKHACPEWDGLVIDKGDPEFDACLCFRENHRCWQVRFIDWLGHCCKMILGFFCYRIVLFTPNPMPVYNTVFCWILGWSGYYAYSEWNNKEA